ncbi:isoprenoid synthase domain-containing protein [Hygrophoropsis aurantiaca]|uniref:Isoprenoid synthase domain-containing protein n=1 Tax=Hygrophoropsis aurantiaca TaxID=72124 RepID=A0ACB7ZTS6_9AGAM|nr:isoprenoid synthase domain-containing protein [Hygrophoropsis aurantiaca]
MFYYIPDTMANWPPPRIISPHYEEVKAESEGWLRGLKPFHPQSQKAFEKGDFCRFASLAYPRLSKVCRSIEGYLRIRRDNVGSLFSFALLHLGMDFPDEVFYHPVLVELLRYMSDIVLIDNDMLSYNREQAIGDASYNIITVIMHELHLDLGSAFGWAAKYHAELRERFFNGLGRVPSWGPTIDKQMQEFLDALAIWLRGNICWSFESERYFGKKGAEIQKTRILPLLPKIKVNTELHREDVVVAEVKL